MKQGKRLVSAAETTALPTKGRHTATGKWVRTLEGDPAILPEPPPRLVRQGSARRP